MTLAVATPDPIYRVIGDDWPIRVQFTQTGGTPLDLTSATVFADVFKAGSATPVTTLSLGLGATLSTTANAGTVDFLVPRTITAAFTGQDVDTAGSTFGGQSNYPNRLSPYVVDSIGRKITPQIVPIVPVDRRATRVVPPSDIDPVTLLVGQQGPSGASLAGLPNGVAPLDSGGRVPLSSLQVRTAQVTRAARPALVTAGGSFSAFLATCGDPDATDGTWEAIFVEAFAPVGGVLYDALLAYLGSLDMSSGQAAADLTAVWAAAAAIAP